MNEPDFKYIISQLHKVRNDLLREEIADWAQSYITDDELTVKNDKSWDLLMTLSYLDTQINPGEYLYGEEDIEAWLKEFES